MIRLPALSLPLPIRTRLDDFVALPERRRVKIAVGIAIGLHVLLMLFSGVWISFSPAKPYMPPEDKSLTLTITPPKQEMETVAKKEETLTPEQELQLKVLFEQLPPEQRQLYIDVDGLAKAKNLSKAALFFSWEDSVAGSEIEGEGDSPLPSQEGRDDLNFTQFKNQQSALGDGKVAEQKEAEKKVIPPPKTLPPPPPVAKPPEPKQSPPIQLAKAEIPLGMKKVKMANDDEIALYLDRPSEPAVQPLVEPPPPLPELKQEPPPPLPTLLKTPPAPRPEPVQEQPKVEPPPPPKPPEPEPPKPEPPVQVTPKKEEPFVMMTAKSPKANNSGQSLQQVETKIKGGKMQKGKKGVDAVATVAGRYKKNVYMAVGSRWNYYIQQRGSLIQTGLVQIVITLDAQGKIKGFRVEENSSNEAHAAMIEQCVREAEFDPPPEELLRNGVFEYPLSFHFY